MKHQAFPRTLTEAFGPHTSQVVQGPAPRLPYQITHTPSSSGRGSTLFLTIVACAIFGYIGHVVFR